MVIHTEGEPGAPAVLLLHPMLFSGEQMAAGLGSAAITSSFPTRAGTGRIRENSSRRNRRPWSCTAG